MRRREYQRLFDVAAFATPLECTSEIVDFDFDLLHTLFVVILHRRVERHRHGRVVVAMTTSDGVGFPGFPQLLQGVLPHRLQHPVSRLTGRAFGDDKRLVDKQQQLIEDLVALAVPRTADCIGGVEVEAAHECRHSAQQYAFGFAQQRVRPID